MTVMDGVTVTAIARQRRATTATEGARATQRRCCRWTAATAMVMVGVTAMAMDGAIAMVTERCCLLEGLVDRLTSFEGGKGVP